MRLSLSRLGLTSCAAVLVAAGVAPAGPAAVELYTDSAPNSFGSPAWDPWWAAAKTDVVAGTFTNLRTGTYPGTSTISPYDEIVYSYGDLGKRIQWIYWIDGVTKAALENTTGDPANDLFEVKWALDWDGVAYTYDMEHSLWLSDAPEAGWIQPGTRPWSWADYSGGVIGTFGFAWWDQSQNPEQFAADIRLYQTYLKGMVRIREDVNSAWVVQDLNLTMIPLPTPIGLAGVGLLSIGGFAAVRRRTRG